MLSPNRIKTVTTACAIAGMCATQSISYAATEAPVCEQDTSVTERFLPVELMTGLPFDASQRELVFSPIDKHFSFVDLLPDNTLGNGEVKLEGPVKWTGYNGVEYEVYERKVPRAQERVALTKDKTAIGRVFDTRSGMIVNEGKYPVGLWQQGQTRSYNTLYVAPQGNRDGTTSIEIEKLSCTYEGTAGAVQYRWYTSRGLEYAYIYVPGRSLTQVMTRKPGR
jgi:hypothetical protein